MKKHEGQRANVLADRAQFHLQVDVHAGRAKSNAPDVDPGRFGKH